MELFHPATSSKPSRVRRSLELLGLLQTSGLPNNTFWFGEYFRVHEFLHSYGLPKYLVELWMSPRILQIQSRLDLNFD